MEPEPGGRYSARTNRGGCADPRGHAEEAAEPLAGDALLVPDLDGDLVDRCEPLGEGGAEPLRSERAGWFVHKVAGEGHRLGDASPAVSAFLGLTSRVLTGDKDEPGQL